MPSPEWLIERGIGETRYALVDGDDILEARVSIDGVAPAGTILEARLASTGRNAIAVSGGQEYLLPNGAAGATEGGKLNIQITREMLGGSEPWKRPLARAASEPVRDAERPDGIEANLDDAGWPDLMDEARCGIVAFPGGELRVSLTQAMTLIDVDGHLPPTELAVAGARAAAQTIRRHGIGGSIGVDLPTTKSKDARQKAAAAVDEILPQPFERTAVNGFGFLQIVRPRKHASLFELAADRAAFEARALLRQASREIGPARLVAHPAVIDILNRNPGWLEQLGRRIGGQISLRSDASVSMSGGHAERA
jgi:hypothetical protein